MPLFEFCDIVFITTTPTLPPPSPFRALDFHSVLSSCVTWVPAYPISQVVSRRSRGFRDWLFLAPCVILGWPLLLSGPQSPHLRSGDMGSPKFPGLGQCGLRVSWVDNLHRGAAGRICRAGSPRGEWALVFACTWEPDSEAPPPGSATFSLPQTWRWRWEGLSLSSSQAVVLTPLAFHIHSATPRRHCDP